MTRLHCPRCGRELNKPRKTGVYRCVPCGAKFYLKLAHDSWVEIFKR